METEKEVEQFTVAELFCGCGGFSHGFWQTGKFRTVFGNDIKKHALRTFELNHSHGESSPFILHDDIRTVTDSSINELLRTNGVENLDCLLGGPPCQGFSQMRRTGARKGSEIVRYGGYNKLDQDPRNDLVLRFLEIAAAIKPKVIVIENVPQFLSHFHDGKRGGIAQQVEEILCQMGYQVTCGILNAADFGVPQLRQRAVIIASRLGHITLPSQTHSDPSLPIYRQVNPWVTVMDALADLPPDPPFHETLAGRQDEFVSIPRSSFAKLMRTSESFPYNHITRNYQRRVLNIIQQMRPGETWDEASDRMRGIYAELVTTLVQQDISETRARMLLEKEGKIISAFYKRYYWSAYTRLDWNKPALTITANSNFLGSGRFTHPDRCRGITMREAARLQSFDDAFTFYTSEDPNKATENIGVGLDMIGEAVPPLLAKAIGKTVAVHLNEYKQ
ncbi:DNA cytosine methyltransferase [Propionivibrio sp.]|uniref:DNA cytosine methyltransferase n=1 Tax=Propionivibrio sp. TaxID=2212460 RepID=UPI003BF0A965